MGNSNSGAFIGFESWYNALLMTLKMYAYVFFVILGIYIVAGISLFSAIYGFYSIKTGVVWIIASVVSILPHSPYMNFANPDGTVARVSASYIFYDEGIRSYLSQNLQILGKIYLYCLGMFALYPVALKWFWIRGKKAQTKKYIRGAKLISVKEYEGQTAKKKDKTDLPFGQVRMPVSTENRHTLIVGSPGTGKTQCLSQIIERLKQRDERAIIYDFKGDFVSKFYDPDRDYIFNPLDSRSVGWNVFNDIQKKTDIDSIASSLIPDNLKTKDPFWNNAARDVFIAILRCLHENNCKTNEAIWETISSSAEDIKLCLAETRGCEIGLRPIEDVESRQTQGVLSSLMQFTRCFEYMTNSDNFVIGDWLERGEGFIFVSNYADIKDTLKPILSLFIDLLSRKLLSMSDSSKRKVFFIIDEFGTLQQLNSILMLLTLSRSKGGCCFLGIQDYGQIDKLYGREHKQSIVNACGNSVTFALSDFENAKYASNKLGETEYSDVNKSESMGVLSYRDGINLTEHKKKEVMVLPSEITNLESLNCYVRFSGYNAVKSKFAYKHYKDVNKSIELVENLFFAKK